MTLVEIIVILTIALALYFSMKPLQKKLEHNLLKLFKSKHRKSGTVIDITDYSKKNKNE